MTLSSGRALSPEAAKDLVHSGGELAFLDLREAGQFGEGHPLFAVPCPFSRLEALVEELVPRRTAPLLLLDAGDGVCEAAACSLQALGYTDISIVEGGAPAWEAAGFTLFKGVNVPSKTLGELAEHVWAPEVVAPGTLHDWSAKGRSFALFDGRPPAEYRKMHVPGAVCLPNGELAYRLAELDLPEEHPIIVGCAGRTRGIVGAIGLQLLGAPGPVYALENGTQGWALAGFELERGVAADPFPPLSLEASHMAREKARSFAARWDIPVVSATTMAKWIADPARTTYVFDVRSEAESVADPIAIAPHAPSGQLAQASDQYIGVRRARVVLCDDSGIRAGLAAFWLRQLGFEPVIALIDDALRAMARPMSSTRGQADGLPRMEARAALSMAANGEAILVDLRGSQVFRDGHVAGAVWSTRAKLGSVVASAKGSLLIVAEDDAVLRGAAIELGRLGCTNAAVVAGGHAALVAADAHVVTTPEIPSDSQAIDFLLFVHDRHDGNLESSRRYLEWEQGLVAQLDEAERAEFALARPPS